MDNEFADQVHEFVEAGDVDADGLLGGLEPIAGDRHSLALRQASSFRSQVRLTALGRGGRRSRGLLVVKPSGAEGRHRVVGTVDVDAER